MKSDNFADRFEQDLERLHSIGSVPEQESLPQDYLEALDVASHLYDADFSSGSSLRETLRSRLEKQAAKTGSWRSGRKILGRPLSTSLHWAGGLVLLILLVLGLNTIFHNFLPTILGKPAATPTIPLPSSPPPASLEINGQAQTSGVGSYCWITKTQGDQQATTCVDKTGVPTPAQALLIDPDAGIKAHLRLALYQPPDELIVSMMPVNLEQQFPGSSDQPYLFWSFKTGSAMGLPLARDNDFDLPLRDPGLYVIQISVRWKTFGDVLYGFLVQIGPQGSTPVPLGILPTSAPLPLVVFPGTETPAAPVVVSPTAVIPPTPQAGSSIQVLSPALRIGKGVAKSLSLSPDGHWLAVATPLGVYEYQTGTYEQSWFYPVQGKVVFMSYDPASQRLALGMDRGQSVILESSTGRELAFMTINGVTNLAWSPDSQRLVSGTGCENVTVWDSASGARLAQLRGDNCSEGYSGIQVAWSPDGSMIYAITRSPLYAWDAKTYQPVDTFEPPEIQNAMAAAVNASPREDLLAVYDMMGATTIDILDSKTGRLLHTLDDRVNGAVTSMAWSSNGKRLAVNYGGGVNLILIWDARSGQVVQRLEGYNAYLGFGWLPDGNTLVGLYSPEIMLASFDLRSLQAQPGPQEHQPAPQYITWTSAGLVSSSGANLEWWDPLTGKLDHQETVASNADWIVSWPDSGPSIFLFARSWDKYRVGTAQNAQALAVDPNTYPFPNAWSPDGSRLSTGDIIWDVQTGQPIMKLQGYSEDRKHDVVTWSPDGSRLAAADSLYIQPPIIWQAADGKLLQTLETQAGDKSPFVDVLAWSPDERFLAGAGSLMDTASGISDGMILLWNPQTGKQEKMLIEAMQQDRILAIAWSPDSKYLAAGLTSGRIILWDMSTFTTLAVLQGHADGISRLAWSPDSLSLASSSQDGTILIWNTANK